MKKGVLIATLISGAGLFATIAMVEESMNVGDDDSYQDQTRTYEVADFTGVSTAGPQDVEIVTGDVFSVRAEGSSRELDLLEVLVEDGILVIRAKRESEDDWNWSWDSESKFYVTAPNIASVSLAGAGNLVLDKAAGDLFTASISGPGDIDVGSIAVGQANITINGDGDFTARGTAGHSIVSITGDGDVSANAFTSETASVTVVGSGDANLVVSGDADINIVGSGDVTIAGSATCRVSRAGSGDVTCGIIAGPQAQQAITDEDTAGEEG